MEPLAAGDPRQVGPYRLMGSLGAGGMGAVFLGRSAGGRTVAVKLVRREFASDEEFRARFRREVEAARAVSGAFTASVVDADTEAEMPWLATTFVPGVPLSSAVRRHGGFDEPVLRALGVGLAEALQEIHRAGVIHRDLKPANVMLAADGPHVIDFGISRAVEGAALTSTGFVVGSPGFLSPEQAMGNQVVPATDVFALGATLAYAANGTGPFGDGPTPALLYRVVSQEPDLSAIPESLRPAVTACLAKDPVNRPTPAQLVAALSEDAPAFSGGWLPQPVLRDIVDASAVLTGAAGGPADATHKLQPAPVDAAAGGPQGFGPPTPPPFPPPQYAPQQGQGGQGTPPPFPPAYPPQPQAQPSPYQQFPQQQMPSFQQQSQQQGQQQGQGGGGTGPTRPMPQQDGGGSGSGMSRRTLLGLIGGGVVVVGGAATAFALSGGSKPTPKPGPSTGPTGGPSASATPTGGSSTAPSSPSPVASGPLTPVTTAPGTMAGPAATPVWSKVLNDTVYNMVVGNGTLVAVCIDSTQGLKTSDGTPAWRGTVDLGSGTISSQPYVSGSYAYVVGQSNSDGHRGLDVVSLADGTTKWSLNVPNQDWELQGAYGILGNNLYITANIASMSANGLWVVDISTQKTAYTTTGAFVGSLVVPPSGNIVLGFNEVNENGTANGFNATTGQRIWSQTPQYLTTEGLGGTDGCLADGMLFFGGQDLHAVNPNTGTASWTPVSYNSMDIYGPPSTDGAGRVFVTAGSTLYCVRASDGTKLWQSTGVNEFTAPGNVLCANGMAYVNDDKGVLYAVNAATGVCAWSYANPAATGAGVDISAAADAGGVYYAIGTQVFRLPVS